MALKVSDDNKLQDLITDGVSLAFILRCVGLLATKSNICKTTAEQILQGTFLGQITTELSLTELWDDIEQEENTKSNRAKLLRLIADWEADREELPAPIANVRPPSLPSTNAPSPVPQSASSHESGGVPRPFVTAVRTLDRTTGRILTI